MASSLSFEMRIADIFRFADGRTVFIGPIDSESKFVGPCLCELVVDGVHRSTIRLEGEMVPSGQHPEGFRSVCTQQPVVLNRETVLSSACSLRAISA